MTRVSLAAAFLLALGLTVQAEEKKPADNPQTPEEFVAKAIECCHCGKDVAERAAKNATDPDVRKFAQRLVEDHAKLHTELTDLAKEKKVGVVVGFSKEHKEKVAELDKLSGKAFDRKFIDVMIEAHEKAIKMLEQCQKEGKDEKCRAFCEKALPTLRKHLDEAKTLQKKLAA
jgi:putative membrane protein